MNHKDDKVTHEVIHAIDHLLTSKGIDQSGQITLTRVSKKHVLTFFAEIFDILVNFHYESVEPACRGVFDYIKGSFDPESDYGSSAYQAGAQITAKFCEVKLFTYCKSPLEINQFTQLLLEICDKLYHLVE